MSEDQQTIIAEMHTDLRWIKERLSNLDNKFVFRSEFEPIKKAVYITLTLILTGIIGAILGMILINPVSAFLILL